MAKAKAEYQIKLCGELGRDEDVEGVPNVSSDGWPRRATPTKGFRCMDRIEVRSHSLRRRGSLQCSLGSPVDRNRCE